MIKVVSIFALANVTQLVGASSRNWKMAGLILGQGTSLGWGFDLQSGM